MLTRHSEYWKIIEESVPPELHWTMSRSNGLIFDSSPGCLRGRAGVAGLLLLRESLVSGNRACWLMLELGENSLEGRCLSPTSRFARLQQTVIRAQYQHIVFSGLHRTSTSLPLLLFLISWEFCPLLMWRHPSGQWMSNLVWPRLPNLANCMCNHMKSLSEPPDQKAVPGFWRKTWHWPSWQSTGLPSLPQIPQEFCWHATFGFVLV